MNKAKRTSEKGGRILIGLIGAFLILWNANSIGLKLLGKTTTAYNVQLIRVGTRDDSSVGTEYRFNANYSYKVNGKEYNGLDTGIRGPRLGPKYKKIVYYYPFAPQVSSMFVSDITSPGIILTSSFGIILILVAVIPCKK